MQAYFKQKPLNLKPVELDDSLSLKEGKLSVTNPTHSDVLTQAEYNALPEEQRNAGIYVVENGEEEELSSYDTVYIQSKTPYINGIPIPRGPRGLAGPDGNPIGTVISLMGTTPPKGYLVCDGSILNITDYPKLADFFEAQFGSSNHFGGDGETTFGIPNLQDLFLRGYNPNEDGLSGEIGEKQEATHHVNAFSSDGENITIQMAKSATKVDVKNTDTCVTVKNGKHASGWESGVDDSGQNYTTTYTSRPVNMAVLYCIKATYIAPESGDNNETNIVFPGEVYFEEETRIGTWIDGKPVYQKVINIVMPSITDEVDVKTTLVSEEIDTLVFFNCHIISTFYNVINVPYSTKKPKNNPTDADEDISTNVFVNTLDGFLYAYNTVPGFVNRPGLVIVKYTKTTDEPGSGLGTSSPAVTSNVMFGHGLKTSQQSSKTVVEVDAVDDFSGDKTLPMTAHGVETQVGNIETVLKTL